MKNHASTLENLFSKYPVRVYKKGEMILRSDDEPMGIYYIKSGYVRMYQIFEDGKEFSLVILKPQAYFPMIWAFSTVANSYFFESFTETMIYRAPRDEVVQMLKDEPEILINLTNRMATGFYNILSSVEKLLSNNACNKIVFALINLANRFGVPNKNGDIRIKLSFSHEELAKFVCLTRETTSIEMKKLMDEGLIYYHRRRITIKKFDDLRTMLECVVSD